MPSRGGLGWGWGCQESEVRGQGSEKPFHRKERKEKTGVIASEAKQSRKCAQQKNAGLLRFARNDGFLYSREAAKNQNPQHFLYFLPLPQGHGSFRPTLFLAFGFS